MDKVKQFLEEGNRVNILHFDFSKSFDSVCRHGYKFKVYKYYPNRTMRVVVADAKSEEVPVLSDLPKGFIFALLLFCLIINDLPECVKNIFRVFADDVKMIVSPESFTDVQIDLCALSLWESKWLLHFNLEKCMFLHVGQSNPRHSYNFSGSVLKDTEK